MVSKGGKVVGRVGMGDKVASKGDTCDKGARTVAWGRTVVPVEDQIRRRWVDRRTDWKRVVDKGWGCRLLP